MKIRLDRAKLLGYKLKNDVAIKGKKGNKQGDFKPPVIGMAGVKNGTKCD